MGVCSTNNDDKNDNNDNDNGNGPIIWGPYRSLGFRKLPGMCCCPSKILSCHSAFHCVAWQQLEMEQSSNSGLRLLQGLIFYLFQGASKSVYVLFNGRGAIMVLTWMFLK